MRNRTYDALKWIALVALPALATLTATLGEVWSLPHRLEITATVTALNVFLGALVGTAALNYHKTNTHRKED